MATTPELEIPYNFGLVDPGTEPLDRYRLISDRGIPKNFSTDVAACSGLTYGYFGGVIVNAGALSRIAKGTIALTNTATNYVERTAAGVVSVNTSGWTTGKYAMAKVVCAGGVITSIEDWRVFSQVVNP